jgi:hypothetical protein
MPTPTVKHNINLNCAVCDRLQDIEWAMGGFLLFPGSYALVTQVICQSCGPSPEAKQLMNANRLQHALGLGTIETESTHTSPANDCVGCIKTEVPHYY